MMKIVEGRSLKDLTTFRIGGPARFFAVVKDKEDLIEAVDFAKKKSLKICVIGGGSNILVSDKGFDGLVIKMEMKGIEVEGEAGQEIEGDSPTRLVRSGAGEDWDGFVAWCVEKNYGGLENLSLIPGTVGAAPVQNIGAYGVEVGDLVESVEAFDTTTGAFTTFSKDECRFAYRDSVFKHANGRYVIVSVVFKLKENTTPDISYKDLAAYFNNNQETRDNNQTKTKPSIAEVREAVIAIRTAKLPDVRKVGTAGSFFKNPILSNDKYQELKSKYPELPGFVEPDGRTKVPLAWIIDKVCGLKGKNFGKAGIHDTQALVIVNYEDATFEDVEMVANEVEKSVKMNTGIEIEREVVMV